MKSVMIDLETLGTRSDSAVISIGAVAFDETQILASEGWVIRPVDWIGFIDPSTVHWWLKQSDNAKQFSTDGTMSAELVACAFAGWFNQWGGDECWANDPSFDCVILENWWRQVEAVKHYKLPRFPIHYRTHRSMRTMMAECERLGINVSAAWQMNTVAHNPVDDAANQARAIMLARSRLVGADHG